MNTVTCATCQSRVTRGNAYIRSVSLTEVATCRPCWQLQRSVDAVFADPSVVVAGHVRGAA